jgi:hypothetical protein
MKIVFGAGFIILAVILSPLLALKSEGIALQYGLGTPGLYVADQVIPPSVGGLELMSKATLIQVTVDAPLCFLGCVALFMG